MTDQFKAFLANGNGEGEIVSRTFDDLPQGEVTIRVHYSGVNYKDGLAMNAKTKVAKGYPLVPGIDLAGEVTASEDPAFTAGDLVIVTSYELGVGHDGGYSEYARVPAEWVVPLPEGLTTREAMIIGTAGFTAALSVHRLEERGLTPEDEPVLVTGSTGGVGSMAVAMLSRRGYSVTASTGKETEHDYLKKLGAKDIISREEVTPEKPRPLQAQRWAAAVDPTGGKPLASILSAVKQGGAVAASGLTAGTELPATVMPFILRGVDLLGIDSGFCPMEVRKKVWERAATDLKPDHLNEIASEISLEELSGALKDILENKVRGRVLVKL
ncbi:acryloyl-CoA reductase [Salipaludibacillus aurantiacus]|uniref:Putative quinone oxidoreductase, YhdH/YhfP family n=1 Tax=Salipaludibacillus aurantiacus TaxID=1601833 RepID=A0A1H9UYS1_9BACI|nr:acryloyl-CoA reductase [Salipaludibacillus aurantiacus]SES14635.1 putative quinone oxidoreductase, YhdH/YhfP family [Salipaludibacillus aurantiacus]